MVRKDFPVELTLSNKVREGTTQNLGKENPRPREQPLYKYQEGQGNSGLSGVESGGGWDVRGLNHVGSY